VFGKSARILFITPAKKNKIYDNHKGLMNTKTAKKIAKNRHKFMEEYLDQFFKEWNGEI